MTNDDPLATKPKGRVPWWVFAIVVVIALLGATKACWA